jgi:asparagine synthase (glutamine-hydrolysing)
MPGLLGIVEHNPNGNLKSTFANFLVPMDRGNRLRREICFGRDGRWALARIHLGRLQPDSQVHPGDPIQVLLHGDLSNQPELQEQVATEVGISIHQSTSALVKQLYQKHGNAFPANLEGAFCAVVLDERLKRLILINDYFGSYPLYWFDGPDRFVFASELKSVLRASGVKRKLDPCAVADYVSFGFLLGDKTLASQVRLLPPASTLIYSWEDGRCQIGSYASIAELFRPCETSQSEFIENLCEAFNGAVSRSLQGDYPYLLSLSGGLDSRAVLSAVDCQKISLSTYTIGVEGCADEVIARQLAGIAGVPNRFLEMSTDYLTAGEENIRWMVSLTDGMYLTHGLTEMLVLPFLAEVDAMVLLRGHGGELAKTSLAWPLHTDERIYGMRSKDEFVSYMLNRVKYIRGDTRLEDLFTDEWRMPIRDGARSSLEESVAQVSLSPPDICSYLYLTGLHRRSTIPSLELFRNYVDVRMPFVDREFLAALFRSPPRWRDKTDIHRAIIAKNSPPLLKVRNSNTGAPGDAGPVAEKLWDKANSLFKRLNVYGYRHYHRFERWMKQNLLHSVERVLLDSHSESRGMLRQPKLRQLIDETRQGVADHAYLLQVLLILELWQQEKESASELPFDRQPALMAKY